MKRDDIVLSKLQTGIPITCYDFPKAVHFKDAILNLRNKGHDIRMVMIDDPIGIRRQIGQYSYHGKKDTEVKEVNYQDDILDKLQGCSNAFLVGYRKILEKVRVNKATLDFINKEITNYNLRRK